MAKNKLKVYEPYIVKDFKVSGDRKKEKMVLLSTLTTAVKDTLSEIEGLRKIGLATNKYSKQDKHIMLFYLMKFESIIKKNLEVK